MVRLLPESPGALSSAPGSLVGPGVVLYGPVYTAPMACRVCGTEIPRREGKGKQAEYCSPTCRRKGRTAYERGWRSRNQDAVQTIQRRADVKRNYGVTLEEYDAFLAKPCAICGRVSEVLDHDHDTGLPRAGLCDHCNKGIGMLGDNVDRVRKAVAYLERYAPTP